ncbi:hypothetical protein ACO2Q0_19895 [Phenylobacterium sp. VNQ135]|uniref:hypothetical protein n=1 Tax=Phenylobacterium sp. VNQ135 TaxID=3400922 RepID=UPI003BFA8942
MSGEADSVLRVVGKARAVAQKVAGLRRVAQDAQVREAVVRAELSQALHESLIARAELVGRVRATALAAYVAAARPARLRRRTGLSRKLDRVLVRLGAFGQALVIARSGVWRGSGRLAHDYRHMAAYTRRGANPAVAPPAAFDQAWYLARNPDVAGSRIAPLVHYLIAGGQEGREPRPLFDEAFYRRENASELAASGVTALEHYIRRGAAQGRSPHPVFDVAYYLAQRPALAVGEDPVSHYLREGWRLGLSPHPLFDPAWYARQAGRGAHGVAPLVHYLHEGWRSGCTPHPLFDSTWYLEQYAHVAEAGREPLTDFLVEGAAEGRSPGPWFDLPHYVAVRGGGLAPGSNPLVDYLQGGAWAVAEARPGFPTAAYLASRPELAREGLTPLEHWARQAQR